MRTLAWPATVEPGDLSWPTFSTRAASACSSPSTFSSGASSLTRAVALATLSTMSPLPLPLVEKESMATLGSAISAMSRAVLAEAMAMAASCSAFGSMLTAQSAKIMTPSWP